MMRIIELNAQSWRTGQDFYGAVLAALGAPENHGRNLNALIDSMIWGGIDAVEPPYTIRISGTEKLSEDIRAEIDAVKQCLASARAEFRAKRGRDAEIGFEVAS